MARIDAILRLVKEQDASELHLTTGAPPMVRVRGDIAAIPYDEITLEMNELLIFEIMDPEARARYEQYRDVEFVYEAPAVGRTRCTVYQLDRGIAASFRLLPAEVPSLEQLGLPAQVARFSDLSQGLVLLTGPRGAGKSSTMAALVDRINRNHRKHVLVLDAPLEYRHPNRRALITQREVGRNALGFAPALRTALRDGPDVIAIGALEDLESMELALTAADRGHLVLAALTVPSTVQAIGRILDSFAGDRQTRVRLMLADSLQGVLAQRLLRRRDGQGRIPAFEILIEAATVKDLIRGRRALSAASFSQAASRDGFQSMEESLLDLVRDGAVAPEEVAPLLNSRDGAATLRQSGVGASSRGGEEAAA